MTTTWDQIWPLFELRVTCGPLTMQTVTDEDLPGLVQLALDGIHPPDVMPFYTPWSTAPTEELMRNFVAYHWQQRASTSPQRWSLCFAVRRDGELVGTQSVETIDFPVTRTGETGSWLGRRFQGLGTGTVMRQAICALLFDHFGAQEVTSGAFTDNPASLAVSRKVGYVVDGVERRQRRPGELAHNQRLVLTPAAFVRPAHPVKVTGAESARRFLGIG